MAGEVAGIFAEGVDGAFTNRGITDKEKVASIAGEMPAALPGSFFPTGKKRVKILGIGVDRPERSTRLRRNNPFES